MTYRELGKTGLRVSVICQGCWSLVTDDFNWGRNELDDSLATVHAALDAGINFFDTAEGYGNGESEEILGRALGRRRREVVIAGKVLSSRLDRGQLVRACEESLRRLGTDWIDLYQVHWPNPGIPLEETMEALETLRASGKIRFIGVSNFGTSYLEQIPAAVRVESNQLPYSLLWRPIEDSLLPACRAREMSVLCYSPLCQGLLTGKFSSADDVPESRARTRLFSGNRPLARHGEAGHEAETFRAIGRIREIALGAGIEMGALSLAWLLARPGVTSVIAGARDAAQAVGNARAGDLVVPPGMLEELSAGTGKLKEQVGDNCDPWESVSRLEKKS